MNYEKILEAQNKIIEAYKVIDIIEVWLGMKKIKIKLLEIIKGNGFKYHYSNSHWYKGSDKAGPYISSNVGFNTKEEALSGAIRELTFFYNESDEDAQWIENDQF
ncbi:hypothetical protein FDC58_16720 [Clostridium botulinum]|nr:hypothetical protein [Clostridium botulinum]NFO86096.1 hypothetical protein [Clostridium botulinum]NFP30836.1 hypothetical protein [Clostridium botulinum]